MVALTEAGTRFFEGDTQELDPQRQGDIDGLIEEFQGRGLVKETVDHARGVIARSLGNMHHVQTARTKEENQVIRDFGDLTDESLAAFAGMAPERIYRLEDPAKQIEALKEIVTALGVPEVLPFFDKFGLTVAKWSANRVTPSFIKKWIMWFAKRKTEKQVGRFVEIFDDGSAKHIIGSLNREVAEREEEEGTNIGYEANLVIEAATTHEEAKFAESWYCDAIAAGAARIAIKPTALVPLSGGAVATRVTRVALAKSLGRILAVARKRNPNIVISVDSEASPLLDFTREAFLSAAKEYPEIQMQMAAQAYMCDTEERLVDPLIEASEERVNDGGKPLGIRLVCGANTLWEETNRTAKGWAKTPLTESKEQTHANYIRLTEKVIPLLLEGKLTVTFGTMNQLTLMNVLTLLANAGVFEKAPESVRFAMLRGMTGHEVFRLYQEKYGKDLHCHEYVPVIPRDRIVELFKYYLRRIDELVGKNEQTGRRNFLGAISEYPPNSPEHWESIRGIVRDYLEALLTYQNEGRDPLPSQTIGNRGKHELIADSNQAFWMTPEADFGIEETRQWLEDRLQECRDQTSDDAIALEPSACIGSQGERKTRELYSAARPDVKLADVELVSREDIDAAYEVAKSDPTNWAESSVTRRLVVLSETLSKMRINRGNLLKALVLDANKPGPEADAEINEMMDFVALTAKHLQQVNRMDHLEIDKPEGNGTAVVICPKNFPMAIPAAHIVARLAAGYRVIVKPSAGEGEETMLATKAMVDCFHEAGVPQEALIYLPCDNDDAAYLAKHDKCERIGFTGSVQTAQAIHRSNPKAEIIAETGAVNPIIIDETMDLKQAAVIVAESMALFNGQKCSCPRVVLLTKGVNREKFEQQLIKVLMVFNREGALTAHNDMPGLIKKAKEGDDIYTAITECQPGEELVELVPDADEVDEAIQQQASDVHGFHVRRICDLKECPVGSLKEVFGAVVSVAQVDGGIEEAVEQANGTTGLLTASVLSQSDTAIAYALEHLQTGNLYINRKCTGALAHQGFGDGTGIAHLGVHGIKTGTFEWLAHHLPLRMKQDKHAPYLPSSIDHTGRYASLARVLERLEGQQGVDAELTKAMHAGWHYLEQEQQYFSQERETPYEIRGQDDWIESHAVGGIILRVSESDRFEDVLCKVFATVAAGNRLRLSVPESMSEQVTQWEQRLGAAFTDLAGVEVVGEDDKVLQDLIRFNKHAPAELAYQCLQFTENADVSDNIAAMAAETGLYINTDVVTGDGSIDMIPQYRQQSYCWVYNIAGDTSYQDQKRAREAAATEVAAA